MRRPRGALLPPIHQGRLRRGDLHRALRAAVLEGVLSPGECLPSTRQAANDYGAKWAALIEGLAPLARRGWTWSNNPAGMHLMACHEEGDYVRAVAATSSLDLALLSSYRAARAHDDGLFLRFGTLDQESLKAGAATFVAVANKIRR